MIQRFKFFSSFFSYLLMIAGIIVLAGWVGNITVLKSIYPDWATMNVDTAICFLLTGVTLRLLNNERSNRAAGIIIRVCSAIIFLLGSISILNHIFDFSTDIKLLFANKDAVINEASYLGKQSSLTAISFILFAISLFPAPVKRIKTIVFQSLNILIGIIGFLAVMGYMFGSKELYQIPGYASMAFHTSVFFLILTLAALFSRPREGIMKLISSNSTGGKVFRNTFPGFVVVLVLFAWLGLEGERNSFYDAGFGVSIFLIIIIAIFFSALYAIAAFSIQSELVKTEAEALLKKANINLEAAEELAQLGNWEFELQTKTIRWSKQIFRLFDLEPADKAPELDIITEYIHPEDRATWLESYELASQGMQPENKMYRTNPEIIPLRYLFLTWQLEKDETGKLIKLFGITQNITETVLANKKITEREELFSKTFYSKVFGLAIINSEHRVVDINETLTNLLGYKREDFIGKTSAEIGITSPEYIRSRDEILSELLEKGIIENEEINIVTPGGKSLILLLSIEPLGFNKTMYWLITMMDITEKKKADAVLKETEQRAQIYYENAALLIWEEDFSAAKKYLQNKIDAGITDIKSYLLDNHNELENAAGLIKVISVNETSLIFYKARNFEELLTFLPAWFLESSWPVFADELHALMNGSTYYENEISVKTPDGEIKHLLMSLSVPPQFAKDLSKVLVSFVDITALKNAEKELAKSEMLFRKLTSNAPVAIFQTDAQGNCNYVNEEWLKYSGMNFNEAMGPGWANAIHPADRERVWGEWNTAIQSGKEFYSELRFLDKKEKITWLSAKAVSLIDAENNIIGYIGMASDITSRKAAEIQLIEINDSLEAAEEQAGLGSWELNAHRQGGKWSKQMFRFFGLEPTADPPPVEVYLERIHPDDRAMVTDALDKMRKGQVLDPGISRTNPAMLPLKYLQHTYYIERDKDHTPVKFIGTLQDVTERIHAEKSIKESESKYRTLVEQASDAILIVDKSLRYIEVNNMACSMLGYSRDEFLNLSVADITLSEIDEQALRFEELEDGNSFIQERYFKRKDGTALPVEISAAMMENGNYLTIVRNITERKNAELLFAGEKMVMEMIATGKPLKRILNTVALNYEAVAEAAFCSILLLDEDGKCLLFGAGPGLPQTYNNAIDGELIGPNAGSCGTAAYLKKQVIVSDIATDPLWTDYRELALAHNLKACWSTPIFGNKNNVLATFAIYYPEIKKPSLYDLELIDRYTSQVKIALERHIYEKQIKDSEEKYRTLVEEASDGIFIMDELGRFVTINSSVVKLSGYTEAEIMKMTIFDFVFKEDIEKEPFRFEELELGKTVITERIMKAKGNKPVYVDIRAKLIADGRRLVFMRDITDRKKAENELFRSQTQFKNLIENISGVYWVNDLNTYQTLYISPSYETVWGRKCEDLYRNPADFVNAIHPDDKQVFKETHQQISATTQTNISYRIVRPDGETRWISAKTNIAIDSNNNKLEYGYAEDVTEKRIAETTLAESENRLKTILLTEPECVKLLDETGKVLDMNPAGLAMIEADSLDIVKGHKVLDIVKKTYRSGFARLTKNVFRGISGKMEFEITGFKGTSRWLETNAVPLKNADGKIISLLGVTRDITERKNAEQEKQLLTLRNQQTLDTMLDGFILADDKGNILDVNPAYCKMIGYSYEELVRKNINSIEATLSKALLENRIAEMLEKKSVKFETKHCRKDKVLIDLEVSISIMNIAEKPLVAAFVRDITIRKKVQEQLNKNNEELRRLTDHLLTIREEERRRIGREIHDELGQQLTAIKMDVAWLDKKTAGEDPQYKNKLSNILHLLDGSNQSVRRILNELKPSILDEYGLSDAIEAQANQFTANTGIPVVIKGFVPDLKLSEEIATCVFRVFQESLTNITRYAMAKKVETSLKLLNGTLIVNVKDDGKGFDVQSNLNKKTFGILGMKERVRVLGGRFEIQSTIGKGTKIKIILPY